MTRRPSPPEVGGPPPGENETLGHRGRKHDPLYRIRKLLLTGGERLDERGSADLEIEIVSSWNDPLGTRACFVSGERKHRVGRLPARHRERLRLRSDPNVDFGDIGDCRIRWRDAASAETNELMTPARPDWI